MLSLINVSNTLHTTDDISTKVLTFVDDTKYSEWLKMIQISNFYRMI